MTKFNVLCKTLTQDGEFCILFLEHHFYQCGFWVVRFAVSVEVERVKPSSLLITLLITLLYQVEEGKGGGGTVSQTSQKVFGPDDYFSYPFLLIGGNFSRKQGQCVSPSCKVFSV